MTETEMHCPLDPRMPKQREHLPNLTRLDCEISEDGNKLTYIGRDPKTWDIVEVGEISSQ